MAMSMEEHFVAQCIIVPVPVKMVGFQHISLLKGQSPPATFSLLLLQKSCLRLMQHGVSLQPLTPVEGPSIIRACVSFPLRMPLNSRHTVFPFLRFSHMPFYGLLTGSDDGLEPQ